MIEFLGWISATAFAVSALPQVYKSWKEGHSRGVSWGLLLLSQLGEITGIIYTTYHKLYPLVLNYSLNFLCLCIITYYKMRPHGTTEHN